MKVRLLRAFSGPGMSAGTEVEVSSDEGRRMCERGYAEPVRSAGVERATAPPAEQAVTRKAPRKRSVKRGKPKK